MKSSGFVLQFPFLSLFPSICLPILPSEGVPLLYLLILPLSFSFLLPYFVRIFFRDLSLFHSWNFFSFLSEEIRIFFVLLWFLSLLIFWSQFLRGLSFSVCFGLHFHVHSFPQISEKPCLLLNHMFEWEIKSLAGSFSIWVTQASLKGISWILWCEASVSHHQSLLWPGLTPYRRCF